MMRNRMGSSLCSRNTGVIGEAATERESLEQFQVALFDL
jgi:hypothetical protein